MGKTNKVERSELWNEIYNIVKQIPRKDVEGDAVDAPSATTSIEEMLIKMKNKNYRVSRATLYNTIELLLECGLVRRHQFGQNQAHYEKSYFDKQHDHIILTDTGEVIEFCDPRIQQIKQTMEEMFGINISTHSLYFYGTKKQ